jgi:amino acid transporter
MWSFDRLLPQKYTEVSDRLHVPVIALVSVTIFVEFALALTSFTGLYGVWVNASWMGAIVILISALSGIVLPYRKKTKSIYESAPAVVRTKVVGVPLVTIGGLGTLAFVLLFFGTAALSPTVSPVTSTQALSILIWCIIGVAFFYVVRYYRLRQGLDLSMAFAELPPE